MKDKEIVNLYKQNFELRKENAELKKELKRTSNALSFANNKIKQLEEKIEKDKLEQEQLIERIVNKAITDVTNKLNKEHKEEVDKLNAKISRLEKRLNTDSTNSGIPTSKDRIGKHKIQNNREKTDKSIGAQKGHQCHKLEYFKDDEITEIINYSLDKCPKCGGELIETNIVKSDILDVEIKVTKTRNYIHNYKCQCCKKRVSANNDLPRGVTYGPNINSICLSMSNESNTALNKIVSFISGITNNEINLTEGYLVKIQKKAANKLSNFMHNLKEKVISLKRLFWDDTVVKYGIGKPTEGFNEKELEESVKDNEKKVKSGVIRFYGNDDWALLIGHKNKNSDGIDEDGILDNLNEECVVMHDHLILNYNEKYLFQNAECNEHTLRYLKGNIDTFPKHEWALKMRSLLQETNQERNELIKQKIDNFSNEKTNEIFSKYDEIIKLGYEENKTVDLTYIKNKNDEHNLIERLDKYRDNHLLFIKDFSVDFTNNTSERGLRQAKRKLAVSFMFKNINRLKDYAILLSYLETCYRHNISRYEACNRLVKGNPFTIEELCDIS